MASLGNLGEAPEKGSASPATVEAYPLPQITYLFKDFYKEIIVRSPVMVGCLGFRV